uniref:Putative oxidoreductase n=1 Tax=Taxus baccata TaxID=25629 RepID=A0A0F7J1F6_TAXBA|nr:putative oxidoreductase [Taxus baccata]
MAILFLVISCLLMFSNNPKLHGSEAATSDIEYPYSFMTVDAEKAASRTYDYIIVGGGAAGCPLAATLSQHYSVLVVERGDSPYGNPDVETTGGFFKILLNADDYPYVAQRFVTEDGVQLVRGRVLGGGTAVNAAFYSRASQEYIRNMGWDEKLVNESFEWVEKLNAFEPDELTPWSSSLKNGLLEAGVLPYNGYTVEHLEGTKISASIFDNNGKRHTAADLLRYANPDNIVVLLNATVGRILFNQESGEINAVGVEFTSDVDGVFHNVSINQLSQRSEVILSAGTIGSNQLLLLSGIGPSQELKELNITVLLDLPFVGKGISDPPLASVNLESPKPLPSVSVQVAGILDDSQLYIEGLSYSIDNNATNRQYIGLIGSKVAFPLSRGELRINSTDPKVTPSVRYNYLSDPFDLEKCMLGVRVMANLTATKSFQEYKFTSSDNSSTFQFLGPALPQNQSNNEDLANFCRDTLGSFFHYHGGCHIGSVVDEKYRVNGVNNLRVVDGSIYKDSPGTNPQATTMMLGRYTGIRIIEEQNLYHSTS